MVDGEDYGRESRGPSTVNCGSGGGGMYVKEEGDGARVTLSTVEDPKWAVASEFVFKAKETCLAGACLIRRGKRVALYSSRSIVSDVAVAAVDIAQCGGFEPSQSVEV